MYRWVDHTAELELHVAAPDEEGVLAEALEALGELLGERSGGGPPARHEIAASAPDRATLLAEWLSELVFLVESEGFLPARIERLDLGANEVEGTVTGTRANPPHLIKAVTYHRLEMREEAGTWHATVVFDV
jgi:SHS2 domain-containing protein